MKTLTVFTPTYNRVETLVRTYESLCRQSVKDFEWLIIDDGSTDNTEEVVSQWIKDSLIQIRYVKKENGGLHTGYIKAIELMQSEINVCIDSDDYMPDDGVEIILKKWETIKNDKNIAGIIGLDYKLTGEPIGGNFSKTGYFHFFEVQRFHRGDVKIVCRTDILKSLPVMPSFDGEKNFNPVYYYMQVDSDYKFCVINENLCFVDYQPTGMSVNIFNQYRNSPKSFAQLRRLSMSMSYYPYSKHVRSAIHYVSSCIFAKEWNLLSTSPRKLTTLVAIPFGILLNFYIRYKSTYKK